MGVRGAGSCYRKNEPKVYFKERPTPKAQLLYSETHYTTGTCSVVGFSHYKANFGVSSTFFETTSSIFRNIETFLGYCICILEFLKRISVRRRLV